MSLPSTPGAGTPGQAPKQMSSRLLNMKFMQRASAGKPGTTATGSRDSQRYPSSEPSTKRRRVDFGSPQISTPTRSGLNTPDESESLSRQFSNNGQETAWVLKTALIKPVVNGYGGSQKEEGEEEDEAEAEAEAEESEDDIWSSKATTGRQTYGKFTRKKIQVAKPAKDDADVDLSSASEGELSSDDEGVDDDDDGNDGNNGQGNRSRRQKKDGLSSRRAVSQVLGRQGSDTASPLRRHAQQQDLKRKQSASHARGGGGGGGGQQRKKRARKTM